MTGSLRDVADEVIAERLLDRPPVSLFDLAYTYTALDTLARVDTVEGVDPDYVPFMTPDEKTETFTQSESGGDHEGGINTVFVRVEITDDGEATLADPPVGTERLFVDDIYRLGYSTVSNKTSHDTVHSVTFHKTGDVDDIAGVLRDQLEKWFTTDGVMDATEEYDLLSAIAALGETNTAGDTVEETASDVLSPSDIGPNGVFCTVRVRQAGEGQFHYPGEIEALNEGMKRRRLDKLAEGKSATKGKGAVTEGPGLVKAEEPKTVYGGTGTPMATSAGKQYGLFDDANPKTAARTRPLQQDVAMYLSKADPVLEPFRTTVRPMQRLYHIPYFPRALSVEDARTLYEIHTRCARSDTEPQETLSRLLLRYDDIRLYTIMVTFEQSSIRHPQFEIPALGNPTMEDIVEAHQATAQSWPLNAPTSPFIDVYHEYDEHDALPLAFLDDRETVYDALTGLYYFARTVPTPEYNEMDTDELGELTEFPHQQLARDLVTETPIQYDRLITGYANRLVEYQNKSFVNDGDGVPEVAVPQWCQLQTLRRVDLLIDKPNSQEVDGKPLNIPEAYDGTEFMMGDERLTRDERLEEFISGTALEHDPERRAVFLLGGLVGRLSVFQRTATSKSSTPVGDYPIESMNRHTFKSTVAEVLNHNNVYSEKESDGQGLMNTRYTERLSECLTEAPVDDWSLSQSDIKYWYGLGIAYGDADGPVDTEDEDAPDTESEDPSESTATH